MASRIDGPVLWPVIEISLYYKSATKVSEGAVIIGRNVPSPPFFYPEQEGKVKKKKRHENELSHEHL